MKASKLILCALASFASLSQLNAQTDYMVVETADGTKTRYAVDNVSKVYFSNVDADSQVEFTKAKLDGCYSPNDYTMIFSNSEYEVTLDMYSLSDDGKPLWLMPGTYTVKGTDAGQIDPSYSSFSQNGTKSTITGGTVTVTRNDAFNYIVEMNLTLGEDNTEFKGFYEGNMDGAGGGVNIDFSTAKRVSLSGEPDGTFGIKMNDADWKFEARFDFHTDASATELPAGTYTISDTKAENTLGVTSNIDAYGNYKNFTTYFRDGATGTIVVTKDGDNYTFDIDLTNSDGLRYKGSYSGTIGNMDLSN